MPETLLFPFIDDAMKLIVFALMIALPMMLSRPSRPQAMARLQRQRARRRRGAGSSSAQA